MGSLEHAGLIVVRVDTNIFSVWEADTRTSAQTGLSPAVKALRGRRERGGRELFGVLHVEKCEEGASFFLNTYVSFGATSYSQVNLL